MEEPLPVGRFGIDGVGAERFREVGGRARRLGEPLGATSAREMFVRLAGAVRDYEGLDYRAVGAGGRALASPGETAGTAQEARA